MTILTENDLETFTIVQARQTIGWSQGRLHRKSGLAKSSVVNAEKNRPVQRSTARLLLMTINRERLAQGQPEIKEDQMLWNIRDYGRGDDD